jgi:hypothetical protein
MGGCWDFMCDDWIAVVPVGDIILKGSIEEEEGGCENCEGVRTVRF